MPRGGTRGVQTGDASLTKIFDDFDKRINEKPDSFYTEGNLIEVTFTASTLDQTIAHKLSGSLKGAEVVDLLSPTGTNQVVRAEVQSPLSERTHVRLVASGDCEAQVWCWR